MTNPATAVKTQLITAPAMIRRSAMGQSYVIRCLTAYRVVTRVPGNYAMRLAPFVFIASATSTATTVRSVTEWKTVWQGLACRVRIRVQASSATRQAEAVSNASVTNIATTVRSATDRRLAWAAAANPVAQSIAATGLPAPWTHVTNPVTAVITQLITAPAMMRRSAMGQSYVIRCLTAYWVVTRVPGNYAMRLAPPASIA